MAMTMTLSSMLIAAAAVVGLCSVAPAASAREEPLQPQIVGGWKPIKNVNDPHVQEIGRWAVSEHIKTANDGLGFGRVVSGEEQIVAGKNYRLRIQATKVGGQKAMYRAVVYEQLTNTRQLLSFDPAN